MKKAVGLRPDLSPPGRCRSLPVQMEADKLAFPVGHAGLAPVPGHLRRPGDFRSYCHAPARLWPPEPSTDSLDLTHFKGEVVTAD